MPRLLRLAGRAGRPRQRRLRGCPRWRGNPGNPGSAGSRGCPGWRGEPGGGGDASAGGRPAAEPGFPEVISPFASYELSLALTLTGRSAEAYLDFSVELATKLPKTMAALEAGQIDIIRARIIAEATHVLSDEHTAAVEDRIFPRAGQQTSGQLRAALARAVLAADPGAARARREEAQRDARVLRWREDAGTAALCGRDLPSADVLAADQRISARARQLRSAGVTGTLDELRARAYLDFLLGRDSMPQPQPQPQPQPPPSAKPGTAAPPGESPAGGPPAGAPQPASGRPCSGQSPSGRLPSGQYASGRPCSGQSPSGRPPSGRPPSGRPPSGRPPSGRPPSGRPPSGQSPGKWLPRRRDVPGSRGRPPRPPWAGGGPPGSLAARINVTVPLAAILGLCDTPGEVAAFGPVDADVTRDLIRAAGLHPATRWCVTVVSPDGQAIGHGCAHGRHPAPAFSPDSGTEPPSTGSSPPGTGSSPPGGGNSPPGGGNSPPGGGTARRAPVTARRAAMAALRAAVMARPAGAAVPPATATPRDGGGRRGSRDRPGDTALGPVSPFPALNSRPGRSSSGWASRSRRWPRGRVITATRNRVTRSARDCGI